MKPISRRSFLAGLTAGAMAAAIGPANTTEASVRTEKVATLIDLERCNGCVDREVPACVSACRDVNAGLFPKPDKSKIKDYWPQKTHEDWSNKTHLIDRLTPYNWIFVQKVTVSANGHDKDIYIPRRCMHCDNPPCSKLCPFGTNKRSPEGVVYIDPTFCFGGAKCRTVCPWSVPQRQAGVGIYTYLDPLPVGGGVMYKCNLCLNRIREGKVPACIDSCPQKAMAFGSREAIIQEAKRRAAQYNGHIYGLTEHGGTGTLYVSSVDFKKIDHAIVSQSSETKKAMRMHNPENKLNETSWLVKTALIAPVAGAVAAFAATISKKEEKDGR
jgi:Fe-S-cluster-containing dehydrogenase component